MDLEGPHLQRDVDTIIGMEGNADVMKAFFEFSCIGRIVCCIIINIFDIQ